MSHSKFVIHIEGNIGSGKTTFMEYLASEMPDFANYITEPIQKWQNFCANNLLEKIYLNPSNELMALQFQIYAMLTTLQSAFFDSSKSVCIFERSMNSIEKCFIPTMNASNLSKTLLQEWISFIKVQFSSIILPKVIIYLRSKPVGCLKRIRHRARSGEHVITIDYLEHLHALHEEWLAKDVFKLSSNCKIIIINKCTSDVLQKLEYEKAIHKLREIVYISQPKLIV